MPESCSRVCSSGCSESCSESFSIGRPWDYPTLPLTVLRLIEAAFICQPETLYLQDRMSRFRVLITDDHALLAEGIAAMLRPAYEVVGIAPDGRQMVADAERLKPDLITLDIGMPILNGLEAARQVRQLLPRVKLVFVTQQVDLRYLQAALKSGANGFVAKQSASSELLAALEQVLRGGRYITPLLEAAFAALDPLREAAHAGENADPLTSRQREVLQLIAEGHTNKSIAKVLNISFKTVEFHKDTLMRALGMRTTAELTRYAVSQGIVNAS